MKSPQKMTAKILQDKEARDPLKVGIIGCGRLGSQLAHCLLTYGRVNPKDMKVSTRRSETLGKKVLHKTLFSIYNEGVSMVHEPQQLQMVP